MLYIQRQIIFSQDTHLGDQGRQISKVKVMIGLECIPGWLRLYREILTQQNNNK